MRTFGLIGKTLKHSFSQKYFNDKFKKEGISGCEYNLYEIQSIEEFPGLLKKAKPAGLNVTIPYKEEVIAYLDELDESARMIGAVNVIRNDGRLKGFNSDFYGFKGSLINWIKEPALSDMEALVLGTGGAAKAVWAVLDTLNIPYIKVSRTKGEINYTRLAQTDDLINTHRLIINTTPLGMSPNTSSCPPLPYEKFNEKYYLYDLVYNPLDTLFMQKGREYGARVKNGLEMLHLQAEKSWDIWNE